MKCVPSEPISMILFIRNNCPDFLIFFFKHARFRCQGFLYVKFSRLRISFFSPLTSASMIDILLNFGPVVFDQTRDSLFFINYKSTPFPRFLDCGFYDCGLIITASRPNPIFSIQTFDSEFQL